MHEFDADLDTGDVLRALELRITLKQIAQPEWIAAALHGWQVKRLGTAPARGSTGTAVA